MLKSYWNGIFCKIICVSIATDNEKHFMIYGIRYDKLWFHFQKLSNAIDGGQGFSRAQTRALANLLKNLWKIWMRIVGLRGAFFLCK